jgi:hypothetical protein
MLSTERDPQSARCVYPREVSLPEPTPEPASPEAEKAKAGAERAQPLGSEGFEVFPDWKTYLLILALPLTSVLLYELVDPATLLGELGEHTVGPQGKIAGYLTGILLTLAPIAAPIPLIARLHKRFGAARWDEHGLFLKGPLIKQEVFLAWESVQTLEPTPSGIQVVPTPEAAPGLWTFHPFRPLIPVGPDERDAVLQAVAGRAGKVQEGRVFGYTPHSWRSALIAILIALPCVVTVMFTNAAIVQVAWAIPADYLVLGATLITLVLGAGGGLYSTSAFLTRIEVREGLLTCASFAFPFDSLRVAIRGRAVWFETPSQKRQGYLRPGEGETLRALLEGAGVEVQDQVPWRARPSSVVLLAVGLVALGLLLGGVPAIWASLQPAHDVDQLWDPFEQGVVIVHERWTGRPLHLVLSPEPQLIEVLGRGPYGRLELLALGGPVGSVNAVEGTWTRFGGRGEGLAPVSSQIGRGQGSSVTPLRVDRAALDRLQESIAEQRYSSEAWPRHPGAAGTLATPQAVRKAGRTVPGFMEQLLGVPEGPLGDYVLGRTSCRFFDVQGPDADLIVAVCHGLVLWVVVLPPGVGLTLEGEGFGYGTALGAPRAQVEPGISRSNLTGALKRLRPEPPTLEQVLEARRRVRSKEATVEAALAWLQAQSVGGQPGGGQPGGGE